MKLKITLKLYKKDGKVESYHSSKTKRIITIVKAEDFQKAYLMVYYGKGFTSKGEIEKIDNYGYYDSPEELLHALSAFTERGLLEYTKGWIEED